VVFDFAMLYLGAGVVLMLICVFMAFIFSPVSSLCFIGIVLMCICRILINIIYRGTRRVKKMGRTTGVERSELEGDDT